VTSSHKLFGLSIINPTITSDSKESPKNSFAFFHYFVTKGFKLCVPALVGRARDKIKYLYVVGYFLAKD
jgi:hypothetical protein